MKRAVLIAGLVIACAATLRAQSVPNPSVAGPVPVTGTPGDSTRDYPFFSTTVDLASRGYVEEEFFFAGTANTYNINLLVPKLDTAVITGSGFPYRTRMIVRRPLSAESFNGTVMMEWQNNAAGYDLDAFWAYSHEHFMRRGYAWIGVSVQSAGVIGPSGLKAWSPTRYASLNLASDALSWDIFSQAAQAVRNPVGVDPMGGLPVRRVLAAGLSMAANRLLMYHNSIHPLAEVFDAILLVGGGALLRTDLEVNVFKLLSETDVAGNANAKSQAWMRQPASDHFRRWEVAGAAHLDFHLAQELAPLQSRDGLPVITADGCTLPGFSHIPYYFVINAAYEHMVDWVEHNVEPPIGPDLEVVTLGPQASILARDSFGKALGGIRLPQHAVPTAINTGLNLPDTPPTNFCRTFGSYEPFDAATLDTLYSDHQSYLALVIAATHNSLRGGFMVGADAAATIRDAARSDIGKKVPYCLNWFCC